ncbi:eukaryotic translation initiation factor 5A-1-like [Mizuhopecten yessoensis]|uniref:Eukaryotic translation initiation factor 5A n=1 Tax=Mizuhopecten yessoensis TaxID=6573 RepID=A0A210PXP5_MIZYE|nr:eukaryotic translation initiation factor 5A-1-like [Mizuhopecten yessoensis]OWF41260.1 Eukaryotic translation initiation factor 5A-1 [Mizuhopecten yessoensis]
MKTKQRRNNQEQKIADVIEETEFGTGDAGSSTTVPQQCSALRKNGYVVIKEHPCKIVEMCTSKTGKHGHAKVHMTGLDIFTQKKYDDICPSTHNMSVPIVIRLDLQVVDVSRDEDGYMSLMNDNGELAYVKSSQGGLGKEIRKRFENDENLSVTVIKAMGEEAVQSFKVISP